MVLILLRAHLCTSALILPLARVYVSSHYHCARLYIWSSYYYAVTYVLAPSYSHLLAYVCPHITTALAYICVLILLRAHLYIYSALILPLCSRICASSIRLDNDQDGPQTAAAAHPEADEVESIAAAARAVFFLNKK